MLRLLTLDLVPVQCPERGGRVGGYSLWWPIQGNSARKGNLCQVGIYTSRGHPVELYEMIGKYICYWLSGASPYKPSKSIPGCVNFNMLKEEFPWSDIHLIVGKVRTLR